MYAGYCWGKLFENGHLEIRGDVSIDNIKMDFREIGMKV
jgi:hypothetical protein